MKLRRVVLFFVSLAVMLIICSGCAITPLKPCYPYCTTLTEAAIDGDIKTLRKLVTSPQQANERDKHGSTALHYVSMNDNVDAATFLLRQGADHRVRTLDGYAPLDKALQWKADRVARLLIEAGADVNATVPNGSTPLTTVAGTDRFAMLRLLVDSGADINKADGRGQVPLVRAATAGSREVFDYLLSNISKPNYNDPGLVRAAVERSDTSFLASLHRAGFRIDEPDTRELTPLYYAVMTGRFNAVEYLINNGARVNINAGGRGTPLHMAALFDQTESAKLMIKHGAIPVEIRVGIDDQFASARAIHWYADWLATRGKSQDSRSAYKQASTLYDDTYKKASGIAANADKQQRADKIQNSLLLLLDAIELNRKGYMTSYYNSADQSAEPKLIAERYRRIANESKTGAEICKLAMQ